MAVEPARRAAERASGARPVHAAVDHVFRSPGRPLDPDRRHEMEGAFGFDFGRVRIHDDARASDAAIGLAARAYAWGSHIGLRRDVDLDTPAGKRVLAHELAHVVRSGPTDRTASPTKVGARMSGEERIAERAASRVARGESAGVTGTSADPGAVRLQPETRNPVPAPDTGGGGVPLQTGSWDDDSVSINLTPTPSGADRDRARDNGREDPWCQFGGLDRGSECKPLQACRTDGASTFMVDAIYRVDGPPPAPEYPSRYQSQPIDVRGDFNFEPASGGDREVSSFNQTVRYAGRGRAVHVHRFQFSSSEDGLLNVSVLVGTPERVVVYNGSVECKRVNCT